MKTLIALLLLAAVAFTAWAGRDAIKSMQLAVATQAARVDGSQ